MGGGYWDTVTKYNHDSLIRLLSFNQFQLVLFHDYSETLGIQKLSIGQNLPPSNSFLFGELIGR